MHRKHYKIWFFEEELQDERAKTTAKPGNFGFPAGLRETHVLIELVGECFFPNRSALYCGEGGGCMELSTIVTKMDERKASCILANLMWACQRLSACGGPPTVAIKPYSQDTANGVSQKGASSLSDASASAEFPAVLEAKPPTENC